MKPADDYAGTWDPDMDMNTGLGHLWHNMKVEASYSHKGPYDREMNLDQLKWPQWKVDKQYGGEEGFNQLVAELEKRGKIVVNHGAGTFRIAPEVASREMKSREQMAKTVASWEKGGRSFTAGT